MDISITRKGEAGISITTRSCKVAGGRKTSCRERRGHKTSMLDGRNKISRREREDIKSSCRGWGAFDLPPLPHPSSAPPPPAYGQVLSCDSVSSDDVSSCDSVSSDDAISSRLMLMDYMMLTLADDSISSCDSISFDNAC